MQGITVEQAIADFKATLDRLEIYGETRKAILIGAEAIGFAIIKESTNAAKRIFRDVLTPKD